jgi:LysM repeat protein
MNGDNVKSIAAEFELAEWQIRRYNDLKENQKINPGDIVFIMPKKTKSEEYSEHVIQEGESLRDVANKYGVKLHALKQFNGISKDDYIEIGTVVKLQ